MGENVYYPPSKRNQENTMDTDLAMRNRFDTQGMQERELLSWLIVGGGSLELTNEATLYQHV